MLASADPVGIQQLRRTYKYFKDYRQVCGASPIEFAFTSLWGCSCWKPCWHHKQQFKIPILCWGDFVLILVLSHPGFGGTPRLLWVLEGVGTLVPV